MSEIITTYLLNDPDQMMPMNREEFYDSQIELFREGKKANRAAAIIDALIFTPDKEVIVQKRSNIKKHNPGLIDKTIGGHVVFGDTPTYTALTETLQEMQIPSIILDTEEDFKKTYRLLKKYLNNSALIQFVDSRIMSFEKLFGKEVLPITKKYYFYLGVYGGPIRPADKEASGIMFYNFEQLKEEMKETPGLFTKDLHFYLDKYSAEISQFLNSIG